MKTLPVGCYTPRAKRKLSVVLTAAMGISIITRLIDEDAAVHRLSSLPTAAGPVGNALHYVVIHPPHAGVMGKVRSRGVPGSEVVRGNGQQPKKP